MATRLAVVVPTTNPWPEVQTCIDALLPQAEALHAEIIVADGDGYGVPDDVVTRHRDVLRVVRRPGASVLELRAMGVANATADIIGITEDHCCPAPDWCRQLVDAYDRHPDADAVGGAVTNGTRDHLIDRANYFMTFAGAVPPLNVDSYKFPPVANVSFLRTAIPDGEMPPGDIEMRLGPGLLAEGRLHIDDGPVVSHSQSQSVRRTLSAHFHNGRATAGLIAQTQPWRVRRHRLRAQLGNPYRMVRSVHRALRSKPQAMKEATTSFPVIAVLALCHTTGAVVGLLLGPGNSPGKLN